MLHKRTRLLIFLTKLMTYLWDICVRPIYLFVYRPAAAIRRATVVKARSWNGNPAGPYRSSELQAHDSLLTLPFSGCSSLGALWEHCVDKYGERKCMGTREVLYEEDEVQPNGKVFKKVVMGDYKWLTYRHVSTKTDLIGRGLYALGVRPRQRIAIFCETRAEWMQMAIACFRNNYTVVTLYATLGEEAILYGVTQSEASHIMTSSELLPKFRKILSKLPDTVKCIIYAGVFPAGYDDELRVTNVKVYSLDSVEQLGKVTPPKQTTLAENERATLDDIAVLMYTSGTTGVPKGVLLSHKNLLSVIGSIDLRLSECITPEETYCAYLPLAHALELNCELSCLAHGAAIGYSSAQTMMDNASKLKAGTRGDLRVLRPTVLPTVPMMLDRMGKAVIETVQRSKSDYLREIFYWHFQFKKGKLQQGFDTPVLNSTVYRAIRKVLGGRVRMIFCGGAPLSREVQEFANICFCCMVVQGYGLTETCAGGTIMSKDELLTFERVGAPVACNEILLREWKEAGYTPEDHPNPRGEVLISGDNVCVGYYKNDQANAEAFVNLNGRRWFCTGDIGEMQPDGTLRIIDRKKDLLKLQGGEYVALGKVEAILGSSNTIEQVCVLGKATEEYVVALVVPSKKHVLQLAQEFGLATSDGDSGAAYEQLCRNDKIVNAYLKEVQQISAKKGLERFETPQRVSLSHELWTPENGLLTDALKLKRKELESKFKDAIAQMYKR